MSERTITSANSVYILSAAGVYAGVRLSGFAADASFTTESYETGVGVMGVDGKFSRGWVPSPVTQTITLQTDSESIDVFDAIYAYQQVIRETVRLTATIEIPAVSKSFVLTDGILTNYSPIATHNRVQSPISFQIVWGACNVTKI